MDYYPTSSSFDEAFEQPWLGSVDLGDIGEVRRLLGPIEASLSDGEVIAIRDACVQFADTAYHWWRDLRRAELAKKGDQEDNFEKPNPAPTAP